MIALWVAVLIVGVAAASYGSRRAVAGALELADVLGISSGMVGVTIVAVGTDLPEIANSISAALTGHGDINVGDSTGSALTQVTLVLAILLLTSRSFGHENRSGPGSVAAPVGFATVGATILIAILIADGELGRLDGAGLVVLWTLSLVALHRWQRASNVVRPSRRGAWWRHAVSPTIWLVVVAVSATAVVRAFVELTEAVGVPELIASTVVLALGTSLPELVVDWTAIRSGAAALAVGDLFGSSLVDATLSVGIGPALRSTVVSSEAVGTVGVVAFGVCLTTVLWRFGTSGPRGTAIQLLIVYLACTAAMIGLAGG